MATMKKTQVILTDCPWGHGDLGVRTEMPIVASRLLVAGIPIRVETKPGTSRANLMVAKKDKLNAERIHASLDKMPDDDRFHPTPFSIYNVYPLEEVKSGIFSFVYDSTGLIPIVTEEGENFVEITSV